MENHFKEWADEWRRHLEEMRVQFSLGKMEAAEVFEQQKEMLKKSAAYWKAELDKSIDIAEENKQKLRGQLDDLLLQLSLGKAEGKELFEEQRKRIEQALQVVNQTAKDAYQNSYNTIMQVFDNQTKLFKTHLEVLQLQFALGKMEARNEAENIKLKTEEKIKELQLMYAENVQHNLASWNQQIQEQYDKMKNWVAEFLPKTK